jgi:dolichyl-phosphate-mannose-protein mannosyltransferase
MLGHCLFLEFSFWNDNEERKQIFFIGNVIGFWIEVGVLTVYVGLVLADQVSRRRAVHILTDKARSRLYNTLGFLFIGWAAHYFPFYLMNRQKFLHHYLPAHLIAALFTGGLIEFITSNNSTMRRRPSSVTRMKTLVIVTVLSIPIIWFFFYFRPLSYGDVSLTPKQVVARQWFDIKLHYAK